MTRIIFTETRAGRDRPDPREVELLRQLKGAGKPAAKITEMREISGRYGYKPVNYERRAPVVVEWRQWRGKAGA